MVLLGSLTKSRTRSSSVRRCANSSYKCKDFMTFVMLKLTMCSMTFCACCTYCSCSLVAHRHLSLLAFDVRCRRTSGTDTSLRHPMSSRKILRIFSDTFSGESRSRISSPFGANLMTRNAFSRSSVSFNCVTSAGVRGRGFEYLWKNSTSASTDCDTTRLVCSDSSAEILRKNPGSVGPPKCKFSSRIMAHTSSNHWSFSFWTDSWQQDRCRSKYLSMSNSGAEGGGRSISSISP
mmetsp:Transcript_66769/g.204324  ORF Transcript_66769/g.204324 Transcript_66769/m.204324 type:complete len:235 (-) Transcript_66769:109-813(-)